MLRQTYLLFILLQVWFVIRQQQYLEGKKHCFIHNVTVMLIINNCYLSSSPFVWGWYAAIIMRSILICFGQICIEGVDKFTTLVR